MNLVDIILLAIALGIDCMIVSFAQGLCFRENRLTNSLKLASSMGIGQGIMPVIGFVGINYIQNYVQPFSNWIVFGIFLILGLKFISEAFQPEKQEVCCIGLKNLIALGVATSIDALVSGATLNLTATPLLSSCLIIGIASFLMSIIGFNFGNRIKLGQPKNLEILGGFILIFLAIKAIL